MPGRPPQKQPAPAEILDNLCLGYNGYTSPTLTNPKMWVAAVNVFGGAFGFPQRTRFANVFTQSPTTGLPYTSLKYFAIPGVGSYLLGDQNGKLYSYDTSAAYAQTQRLNAYVDPAGTGSSLLNGPFSRETLQSIVYEMNGQIKSTGRNANAATIEGWGLDTPDASPQVTINGINSTSLSSIARSNGVVTATCSTTPSWLVTGQPLNVVGVADSSYNGFFSTTLVSGTTVTWNQAGQNSTSSGGAINNSITKAVGRSYAYAWENANKSHVGAPSPATQFIQYNAQNGTVSAQEVGTITTAFNSAIVTGTASQFTSAWIGRSIWMAGTGGIGRIASVQSATQLTLATPFGFNSTGNAFQIYDPQATHLRYYATADGQSTYLRINRVVFNPNGTTLATAGLQITDWANTEPPNAPFTSETAQPNNIPPPIGQFVEEYQGVLLIYGIAGVSQSFFYTNQTATSIGLPQECSAPLNQVTLPIQNAQLNGFMKFPGSAIFMSDKQDMFRLTGLLTDNTVTGVAQNTSASQQGATVSRLPYNLGCATPFATALTPLGGIWLTSNREIWLYTDVYAPRNIGRPVQDILKTILPAKANLARAKYFHTNERNWFVLAIPANGASFNNTLLILDVDLLASNGSPSYFTFDMATNSPAWWVFQPGTQSGPNWINRCDVLEHVYESQGIVRLFTGQVDLLQDVDFQGGSGTEIAIPNGTITTHAYGNDSAFSIKRPTFVRFTTNRDPSMLATDGWSFGVNGIDDDFYTFQNPLNLVLTPGVNDTATLSFSPDFATSGLQFRYSMELFRIGGVNFVAGRRLQFIINFPTGTGVSYQFRSIQLGFGVEPPN